MNKETLKKAFREYKKAAGVDFAITAPDSYGDCQSCVWSTLTKRYGDDCHGIFVKHWKHGMNGGDDVENRDYVYIAHDITEEQAATFYDVMGKYYNITPSAYKGGTCFTLYKKDIEVYNLSCYDEDMKATHEYEYTDLDRAMGFAEDLIKIGYKEINISRMF